MVQPHPRADVYRQIDLHGVRCKKRRQLRLPSLPEGPPSRSNPSGRIIARTGVICALGLGSVDKPIMRTAVRRKIQRRRGLCAIGLLARAQERLDEVHGQREHYGGLFAAELEQGLQVAQLKGGGVTAEDLRSVVYLLSGLELTFGVDDLRATLALRLSLTSHSPLHRLRDLHVLDLD